MCVFMECIFIRLTMHTSIFESYSDRAYAIHRVRTQQCEGLRQGPPVASRSKKVMMVSITLTESPQDWYCVFSLFLIHIIIHKTKNVSLICR